MAAVSAYLYRYAFLKISSLVQRRLLSFPRVLPAILDQLFELGSYRNISIHVWLGDSTPAAYHIGEFDFELEVLSAEWFLDDVAVRVEAAPVSEGTDLDRLLIGFVSQQAAQLARAHTLRLANSSLRREIQSVADQVALSKLVNRAQSLLAAQHGITPAQAHALLLRASEDYYKPILTVAREIVAVLGSPALNPAA